MVYPFDTTQSNLVQLEQAAVQHDLISATSLWEEIFCVFVEENLLSDQPNVFDTIQKTCEVSQVFADRLCTNQSPEHSIKSNERSRRAAQTSTFIKIYGKNQTTPAQWKKYLSSGKNNKGIILFRIHSWKDLQPEDFTGMTLSATCADKCWKFSPIKQSTVFETTEVVELECDHEEANTHLMLHAKYASDDGFSFVVVKSPDQWRIQGKSK